MLLSHPNFSRFLRSNKRIGQAIRSKSQRQSAASIHVLDDDSLLNIIYLCRPILAVEDDVEEIRFGISWRDPRRGERWWYRIAHVCKRWRNLVLLSASYLRLHLVCTYGTPIADMLALSPPLPLAMDYFDEYRDITAEDEAGIILALEQRDRVRRVRLRMPIQSLQKFIVAVNEEYPMLEYLNISPNEDCTAFVLPKALQAQHLRHLVLHGFTIPIGNRLLMTAVDLVTLYLYMEHPSAYFQPNFLLRRLSLMPQLETLWFGFSFPVPNHDVVRQLTRTPTTTYITLPNLHRFWFRGVSAYLEAVVRHLTAPRLEWLEIDLFNQLTFSFPHLLEFLNTTETLKFSRAEVQVFSETGVDVKVYPREDAAYALQIRVPCRPLDWRVSSMAQILNALGQGFSEVEHLTLEDPHYLQFSGEHHEVDRYEWRKLLRSFRNAKTLTVSNGLVEDISHSLRLEGGEPPLELLPELQELRYFGSHRENDIFKSFIDARQNAGRPVNPIFIRRGLSGLFDPMSPRSSRRSLSLRSLDS